MSADIHRLRPERRPHGGAFDPYGKGSAEGGPDFDAACALEQSLLAACMLAPSVLEALPSDFEAHHLSYEDHPEIFQAIKLAATTGAKVLIPLVEASLPDLAGPDGYIRSLPRALVSKDGPTVKGYAESIIAAAERAALVSVTDAMRRDILGTGGEGRVATPVIISRAMEMLNGIASRQQDTRPSVTLAEAMADAIAAGEATAALGGKMAGITTGFGCINRRLGGLERGCLYVLGARPSVGKTALALQMAIAAAASGAPCLFISLEMQARQLGRRALSLASKVPMQAIRSGAFTASDRMASALVKERKNAEAIPLLIEDEPALTVASIDLRAKVARRRMGGLGLIVIDHLHIMGRPATAQRHGDTQAITEISMGCKRLAKDLDAPVLLLAQLNRGLEGREDKRPGLSDLRQSGSIEQDADAVFFIYRAEVYARKGAGERRPGESDEKYNARVADHEAVARATAGRADILFDKVREGECGIEELGFDGEHVRFFEDGAAT